MKKIILISLLALIPAISSAQVNRISDASNLNVTPSGSGVTDTIANITRNLDLGGSGITRPFSVNQGYAPTSISFSNIYGSSSSITNGKVYDLITGGPTSPVVNTTNVSWTCGKPEMHGWTYPDYEAVSSRYPTSKYDGGYLCLEFIANTTSLEINYLTRGYGISTEVDGTHVITALGTTATAQAGGASTITLAAASSTANNYYNQQYVSLISGTGSGQIKRITGYDGSTQVATVDSAWATQPDNTTNYTVTASSNAYVQNPLTGTRRYFKMTFGGERRPHHIRLVGLGFMSVVVDSSGTIQPIAKKQKNKIFFVTDSLGSTGAGSPIEIYPALVAKYLGYSLEPSIASGTGIISGGAKLNYSERTVPPTNSWSIFLAGATGGTFTLSQSGTSTSSIAYNASAATIQTALNDAFGANQFRVAAGNQVPENKNIIIGTGSLATSTATMTINSSLTGSVVTPYLERYLGDITPLIPYDAGGNKLPFTIVVQSSVNDVAYSATAQTAFTSYLTSLQSTFPQAKIIATGQSMLKGPETGNYLTLAAAIENAASSLTTINGKKPFISTFNSSTGVGYINGTTNILTATGTSGNNTDVFLGFDGVHHTSLGHYYFADWMAQGIANILNNEQ